MAAVWNGSKKSIRLTLGKVVNLNVGDCIRFTGDNDHDNIKQITGFYFSGMGPPTAIESIAAVRHSDAVRVVAYLNGEDKFASKTDNIIIQDIVNLVKVECSTGSQLGGSRRNTRRKIRRNRNRSRSRQLSPKDNKK